MADRKRTWQKTATTLAVNGALGFGVLTAIGGTAYGIDTLMRQSSEAAQFFPPALSPDIQKLVDTHQATLTLVSEADSTIWPNGNSVGVWTLENNQTGETSLVVSVHKLGERGQTFHGPDFITDKTLSVQYIAATDANGNPTADQFVSVETLNDDGSVALQLIRIAPNEPGGTLPEFDSYQAVNYTEEQGRATLVKEFGADGLGEVDLPIAWNMHIETTRDGHQHLVGAWFTYGYYPGDEAAQNPHVAGENFNIDTATLPIQDRMVSTAPRVIFVGGDPTLRSRFSSFTVTV